MSACKNPGLCRGLVPGWLALVLFATLAGCVGLTPPSKYETREGLLVRGDAVGRSLQEDDSPAARREARMAAMLLALASWSESFVELQGDVERSEDELPLELYDPENPPADLSNLAPYKPEVSGARERLDLSLRRAGRAASSEEARHGFIVTCSLRPGVAYRYEAEWDEFEVQILDRATLQITPQSDYYQPMTLVAERGSLAEPETEIVPLEYVEGLLAGHGIELKLEDRPDGEAPAVLTRRFPPR